MDEEVEGLISRRLIREIEQHFRNETGRPAGYFPSARIGIYAALCELFPPGAGLAMSPVTDDIVVFAVLAAGLRPVFMDIEQESGGLRPDRIPDAAAAGAAGLLTSNLYGVPDDAAAIRKACDERRLILIEDCAHAMGCLVDGKKVGTFGEVSVFSLAKHIGGLGGIVTAKEPRLLEAVRKRAEPYIRRGSAITSLLLSLRFMASDGLHWQPKPWRFLKAVLSPLIRLFPDPYAVSENGLDRKGHRVPVDPKDFGRCLERVGLELFHRYLEVDNRRYLEIPCGYSLWKSVKALRRFDETARVCRTADRRMDPRLPYPIARPAKGRTACYYKVPVFVPDRDRHLNRLAAMGVSLDHIYDPAFPDYLPSELHADRVTDRAACRRWSRDVVPVAVEDIERFNAFFLKRHDD
jgi:hypothetical protein